MSDDGCLEAVETNNRASNSALMWRCAFLGCGKLRVYNGGACWRMPYLDTCAMCGCHVATAPADTAPVAQFVDEHLL